MARSKRAQLSCRAAPAAFFTQAVGSTVSSSSPDGCSTSYSSDMQFTMHGISRGLGGSVAAWWPFNRHSSPTHLVLASLSSSSITARRHQLSAHMPPHWWRWLVQLQLPVRFLESQSIANNVLTFHRARNEAFPRPCPGCNNCQFMVDRHNKPSEDDTQILFETRPWACDQCHRWWHLGCLNVHAMDDLPPKPWFHCHTCRHTFLKLEAAALRGEQPAWELGTMAADYSVSLVTDTDHRNFLSSAAPYLALDSGSSSEEANGPEGQPGPATATPSVWGPGKPFGRAGRMPHVAELHATPLGTVYGLLGEAFEAPLLVGFGNPSAEYAGGKYALLLKYRAAPVATCTFDVYGPHAAQLHLLTTQGSARKKGHARAILDVLEMKLEELGVSRLLVQPREKWIDMFESMGFEVLHPADAAVLHRQLPLAYTDAAVLDKQLSPRW